MFEIKYGNGKKKCIYFRKRNKNVQTDFPLTFKKSGSEKPNAPDSAL